MKVMVTGGAGFIGSHLVGRLLGEGHDVVVCDSLDAQVHGIGAVGPAHLSHDAHFYQLDVRDRDALGRCILTEQVQAIFHQAAAVGVGQSMYQPRHYADVNCVGTATLLEVLANTKHRIEKLIVASSMSIYGEGAYTCFEHGAQYPGVRTTTQENEGWEPRCPECGHEMTSNATAETKPLHPTSIYATTKRDQEEMVLEFGRAYSIPAVALRYFNVYGPGQSLSNPYTGVLAIFGSRLLNAQPPMIFEDGCQTRDFVHVSDIATANLAALHSRKADYLSINVGTGVPRSISDVADSLARELGVSYAPEIRQEFRAGDIRHCYADIGLARSVLQFEPMVRFEEGLSSLVTWMRTQQVVDRTDHALHELVSRGLTR